MRTAASPPTAGHPDHDQEHGRDGHPFQVTVRPTPFSLLVLGFGMLAAVGGLGILAETWATPDIGVLERLWGVGWGLLLIGLFGGGTAMILAQWIGRRPVLILDDHEVRLPAAWPRPRTADRVLPWPHVSRVHAFTQVTSYRSAVHRQHYLAFVPVPNLGLRPSTRLERWSATLAGAPSAEALRYSVHVQPGWSATVEQVAEAARRRKPGLRWVDERDLPKRRVRRWLRRHAARLRLAAPPPQPGVRPGAAATARTHWDPVEALTAIFAASLLVLIYWTPWTLAEAWRQAHLDAHQAQTTARIIDVDTGRYGTSARATYAIGSRQVTSDGFRPDGYVYPGKMVCLEVDATRPARARPCGTRGDLEAFQLWVRASGVATAVSGGLLLAARLLRRLGWSARQTRTAALAATFAAALVLLVFWTLWLLLESRRQAQIDAHPDRAFGQIIAVEARPAVFGGRRATATYPVWDWQRLRAQLVTGDPFPVPRYYDPGDRVCVEMDATAPTRARACDTRGDLDTFTRWVQASGGVAVAAGLLLAVSWPARRRQPAANTSAGTSYGR